MALVFRGCLKARDRFGVTEGRHCMRHCKGLGTRLDRTACCCHATHFRKNTESNGKHVKSARYMYVTALVSIFIFGPVSYQQQFCKVLLSLDNLP